MRQTTTFRKKAYRLNMTGSIWSPAALDVAHAIIRTHGRVEIVELAGTQKPLEFRLHPALDTWSEEQLKPKTSK